MRKVDLNKISDIRSKSPLMIEVFITFWMLPLVYYTPRIWQFFIVSRTIVEFVLLLAYYTIFITFWLFAAYYIAVVLFSFISRSLSPPLDNNNAEWPGVAILSTTCNDFQTEAVLSCLNQDYPNFHLFLLDDSTKEEFREPVKVFYATHSDRVTIVRRLGRQGFKGGNLNHALQGAARMYPFFAVVDTDERLPRDFLRRAMVYMRNSRLAFVQANHSLNPNQDSSFAQKIGKTISLGWDVYCRPRNQYGFVFYLGHGVLVRRSAWKAVGGFPEVLMEDLTFSAVLAEKGLRGIFLKDLICYEDFPATYSRFKKQHKRYIIGTTQAMLQYFWKLLLSQKISFIEKIDFFLWCSPLYMPALCFLFMCVILCNLTMGGIVGNWQYLVVSIFEDEFALSAIRMFSKWLRSSPVFSVLCIFSSVSACIAFTLKGKFRAIKFFFLSTVTYLSLVFVSWRGLLEFLLADRSFWSPTHEKLSSPKEQTPDLPVLTRGQKDKL